MKNPYKSSANYEDDESSRIDLEDINAGNFSNVVFEFDQVPEANSPEAQNDPNQCGH